MIDQRIYTKKYVFISVVIMIVLFWAVNPAFGAEIYPEEKSGQIRSVEHEQNQEAVKEKRVLFISSYSFDWPSVSQQIEGIESALDQDVVLHSDFMDTKCMDDSISRQLFYERMKHELSIQRPYSVIIVGDDPALQFVLQYKEELFQGIPCVLEGIDDVQGALDAAADPMVTGVAENLDFVANIEAALKIYPNASSVVGITDNTITGKGRTQQFYKSQKEFPQMSFQTLDTFMYSSDELCRQISQLNEDTIVLYLCCGFDKEGNPYSFQAVMDMIKNYSRVPVFSMTETGIGEGLLGGYVVSTKKEGAIAGAMAQQIIDGTMPGNVTMQTPNSKFYCYDYQVMKRYSISRNQMPKTFTMINGDIWWKRHGDVLVPLLVGLLAAALLVTMAMTLQVRTRLLRKLNDQNRQLMEAAIHTEEAAFAKQNFMMHMGHEIRTLMQVVIGMSTLARCCGSDKKKLHSYLDKIIFASGNMLNTVSDMTDMWGLENRNLQINRYQFRLQDVLASILTDACIQSREKGIQFDLILSQIDQELLQGDPVRLHQILMNLVSNSIKFTRKGDRVSFFAQQIEEEGQRVRFRFIVKDTGHGMDEEMKKRVFQPFTKADSEPYITRSAGFGLSVAKELTEVMGGRISVDSQLEEGSTFTLELPFDSMGEKVPAPVERFRQMRALILADEPQNCAYISRVLEEIQVVSAVVSAEETAVAMLQDAYKQGNGYDICVVDWSMTRIDGIAVIRQMRSMLDGDTVPIVASSCGLEGVSEAAHAAGADLFIPKPLLRSEIFRVFDAVRDGKYVDTEEEGITYDFSGRKVLIAEDNMLNLQIMTELLSMAQVQVTTAENGRDALELFCGSQPGTFDLILMDIQMPIMDGYEATQGIRSSDHPQAAVIPIYAVTAEASTEDREKASRSGMNGYLLKPIETRAMFAILEKHLR